MTTGPNAPDTGSAATGSPETRSPDLGLDWSDDGAPRSRRFGDVYFSREDGLAETRAVFFEGCGLPDAWADRDDFGVAELGFGTGLNIVALLDLWRRTRRPGARLNVFSIEAWPLSVEDAARALSAWPELAETADLLLARWPSGAQGFHRVDLPELGATLDLAIGDAEEALARWSGRADAWFLDGFSPALNPGMWSDAVLEGVTARSAPGARLATFTVAGAVRRGLAERGWRVDKRPGHGRKRERLEARLDGVAPARPRPSVAVVGAGIAGASVARALGRAGLSPVVLDQGGPGAAASGFPAALVTPRLDAGDAVIAALAAQALERAARLYADVPGAVIAEGVLQLEGGPRDAKRFKAVAEQPIWRPGAMTTMSADEASARLGVPVEVGGLLMGGASAIRPAPVLAAFLNEIEVRRDAVSALAWTGTHWSVLGTDGRSLVEADVVVLAAGWGLSTLAPDLDLGAVRGQADWTEAELEGAASPPPVAWGGYVAPTGEGLLFGATHDRDDTGEDVRPADTARNLAALAARLPGLAERAGAASLVSRAATRATTADRMPVCGPDPRRPGVYVLGGMGSRGFAWSPLLGEHLAARIADGPSPLPDTLAARVDPSRFVIRAAGSAKGG